MRHSARVLLLSAAAIFGSCVAAQSQHYDVKTINFDLWCQETQQLPPDRCDKRLPEDEAAFEDYRAKVEKYEIPYLQGRENGAQLDRVILHADPVDNPVTQNPSAAEQKPVTPGQRTSP
ncbi:MAG: hypothetical protein JSR60_16175 [Proteobacteria bacterium]|nr:hypothetical protein [Pseudomonadota bacterium]